MTLQEALAVLNRRHRAGTGGWHLNALGRVQGPGGQTLHAWQVFEYAKRLGTRTPRP